MGEEVVAMLEALLPGDRAARPHGPLALAGALTRVPERTVHIALPALVVAVTAGAVLASGPSAVLAAALVLCWVALLAATLLPARAALPHVAAAFLGAAAVLWEGGMAPLTWVAVALTLLLVPGTAGLLAARALQLARTDPVTGVADRRFWEHTVAHECARAERTGFPLCVAVMVLDDFREFAFERGHAAAEQLLREAAAAWRGQLRAGDLIGRLGPDHLAVLLPECGDAAARLVLARIQDAAPPGKTCSAGLAMWDGTEASSALIDRALEVLRHAQRTGRTTGTIAAA